MKKILTITTLMLFFGCVKSFSQTINLSADSVTTILCKKWQVSYAMMGDMKIEQLPGADDIIYEFNKDKTYTMTTSNTKDKIKGSWIYDPKQKIIKIITDKDSKSLSIISLTATELTMLANTAKATPDDPTVLKLVYKIKAG